MNVCMLGAGAMGSAMTARLLERSFDVRIWDRTWEKADVLRAKGARAFRDVAAAVQDADVVVTMLADGAAVVSTMDPALRAMRSGSVWLQMSTIGVEGTAQAIALSGRRPDVVFVDAPVSGSTGPARAGTLTILASGPKPSIDALEPLFAALGHKTVWLGDAGAGSRMKLVLNSWLAMVVEGTAEFAALATALGVTLDRVAECLQGGPLDALLMRSKLAKIAARAFDSEFSLANAAKDVRLALQAESSNSGGLSLPMLETLDREWRRPLASGFGDQDVSVVYLALAERIPATALLYR
ncbi:MAG TPA: NAD(P)-dependent oxidoreductase [Candidatus Aquilonibacter sp.]